MSARILGAMRCYGDLVEIVRARIAELGITYAAADDLAGLQDGYIAKLLCKPAIRRMTPWTFFLIFDGLGLEAQVTESPARMAAIADRVARGRSRAPQKRSVPAAAGIVELTPDFIRQIAIKGGTARMARLTPKQRSNLARRANRIRWARHNGGVTP